MSPERFVKGESERTLGPSLTRASKKVIRFLPERVTAASNAPSL